jgi:hypothetical protein
MFQNGGFLLMLVNLLGQLNAIVQGDNALYAGMQAKQARVRLSNGLNSLNYDKVNLSTIAKLHNKDSHLAFAGIKNDFIAKAMDTWYSSLSEKNHKG